MATTLLLIVEGPHDLEFCARLLRPEGFSRIQKIEKLEQDHAFWRSAVPTKWPARGDLVARHPVPLFLSNPAGQSVAIVSAIGIKQLVKKLSYTLSVLEGMPDAIGVIMDADEAQAPQAIYDALKAKIAAQQEPSARNLAWAARPGLIDVGPPRSGVFIMPDNTNQGTLEDLLLEAGGIAYPDLLRAAKNYTAIASHGADLQEKDIEEFRKPAGPNKAQAAAMASILKPGRSIQVSIQDNRWLDEDCLQSPRIKALKDFLGQLIH